MKPFLFYIQLFAFFLAIPAGAQQAAVAPGNGVLRVYDWPKDRQVFEAPGMPFVQIDSLTLGYGYRTIEQQPYLTFALEWVAGDSLYAGSNFYPVGEEAVYLESLSLAADVVVDDAIRSRFVADLSNLGLKAYPDLHSFELADLGWEDIFQNTPADSARQIFERGFYLQDLEIVDIQFGGSDLLMPAIADDAVRFGRPRVREQTIYGPRIDIILDVPIGGTPRPRPRPDDEGRSNEPRGDQVGRGGIVDRGGRDTGEDESSSGSGRKKSTRKSGDEEEEDDDRTLVPAAVVGAVAVAAVAVAGGTVGYYGNMKQAPIGLTAGMVMPEGGVFLQAAINEAVLNKSTAEPERLVGRVLSYYDLFKAPLKPSLGLGVTVTEIGGNFEYQFNVSPGAVGVFGPLLVMGGYEVVSGGVEFGVAVNFRYRR